MSTLEFLAWTYSGVALCAFALPTLGMLFDRRKS